VGVEAIGEFGPMKLGEFVVKNVITIIKRDLILEYIDEVVSEGII